MVATLGNGTAIVGTVSGTDNYCFGSPIYIQTMLIVTYISATFDSTNNKVVIAFRIMETVVMEQQL